jgi:tetratricopeptide (TPR) repeat protein
MSFEKEYDDGDGDGRNGDGDRDGPAAGESTKVAYALVRAPGFTGTARLPLPFTIGASSACDVIINSEAVAPAAILVTGPVGRRSAGLALYDVSGSAVGKPGTTARAARYGISIAGPVYGAPEASSLTRLGREALAREAAVFSRFSPGLRRLAGGKLPQPLRLGLWAVAAAARVALPFAATSDFGRQAEDLSGHEIALKAFDVNPERIGATPDFPDLRKGFTAVFDDAKRLKPGTDLILRFNANGLDNLGELQLAMNGVEVFSSAADPGCIDAFCEQRVRIPAKAIKEGKNVLKATHSPEDSSYLVKDVQLRALLELTPARRAAVDRLWASARRAYDERGIVPENLLAARSELAKLDQLLLESSGMEETAVQALVLKGAIEKEFERLTADLEFKADQAAQLGKYEHAQDLLRRLLSLYPDATSDEHLAVKQRLDELKELAP